MQRQRHLGQSVLPFGQLHESRDGYLGLGTDRPDGKNRGVLNVPILILEQSDKRWNACWADLPQGFYGSSPNKLAVVPD